MSCSECMYGAVMASAEQQSGDEEACRQHRARGLAVRCTPDYRPHHSTPAGIAMPPAVSATAIAYLCLCALVLSQSVVVPVVQASPVPPIRHFSSTARHHALHSTPSTTRAAASTNPSTTTGESAVVDRQEEGEGASGAAADAGTNEVGTHHSGTTGGDGGSEGAGADTMSAPSKGAKKPGTTLRRSRHSPPAAGAARSAIGPSSSKQRWSLSSARGAGSRSGLPCGFAPSYPQPVSELADGRVSRLARQASITWRYTSQLFQLVVEEVWHGNREFVDFFAVTRLPGQPEPPQHDTDDDLMLLWGTHHTQESSESGVVVADTLSSAYHNLSTWWSLVSVAHVDQVSYEPEHAHARYASQYAHLLSLVAELRCLVQHALAELGAAPGVGAAAPEVPEDVRHVRRRSSHAAGNVRDTIILRDLAQYMRFLYTLMSFRVQPVI